MPRTKSGSLPAYRLYKRTGQAVVTINGQDFYLGSHGSAASKEKYNRLIGEWLECGQIAAPAADPAERPKLTVNEMILAYVKHARIYYQDSPKERAKIALALRPLKRLYGRTEADSFGPLALQVVRDALLKPQERVFRRKVQRDEETVVEERSVTYKLARRTINMRIDVLKRIFKWAVSKQLVVPSIYEGLRTVEGLKAGRSDAKETPPVKPVSDEAVVAVLPFVARHVAGLIRLQQLTGARSGELCILRECDIDKNGSVWVYRPIRHKNQHRGQQRLIYLGPKAQSLLAEFFPADPTEFVFSPRRAREERYANLRANRKSKVQPSQIDRRKKNPQKQPGNRYTVRAYRHAVRRACTKSKIEPWHPHQLRHAAATRLRKAHGVELARIILGHKTAFTTEIYAEVDRLQALEVMAEVG
jgi:integrase